MNWPEWLDYFDFSDLPMTEWILMIAIMVAFIIAAIEIFHMIFGRDDWR